MAFGVILPMSAVALRLARPRQEGSLVVVVVIQVVVVGLVVGPFVVGLGVSPFVGGGSGVAALEGPPEPPTVDSWARCRPPPVVGRIQARWWVWKELLHAPLFVEEWVRLGVPLFLSPQAEPWPVVEPPRDRVFEPEQRRWLAQELWRLHRSGALEACLPSDLDAVSPMHLLPKSGRKQWRLVIDQRAVNDRLVSRSVKFEGLGDVIRLLERDAWAVTWDLAEGYMHVLLDEKAQRLMGVYWEGRWFRFRTLTFGLCVSPWVFCKVVRVLVSYWRRLSFSVVSFVDDFILIGRDKDLLIRQRDFCEGVMDVAGFVREKSKGQWSPTQRPVFHGLELDSVERVIRVPPEKLDRIAEIVHRVYDASRSGSGITARWLASLAGKIISIDLAFSPAKVMTRAMFGVIDAANRFPWQWGHHVRVSSQVSQDLEWLVVNLKKFNGRRAWRPPVVLVVEVDASHLGCGGCLLSSLNSPEVRFGIAWSEELIARWELLHINIMELAGVLVALVSLGEVLRDRAVEFRLDSRTAWAYLRRSGGPLSHIFHAQMMRIVRWVMIRVWQLNIHLLPPVWLSGEDNWRADEESRAVDVHDWSVSKATFSALSQRFGPFSVDRFADSVNAHLPRFNSFRRCPGSEAVNCFTQDWSVGVSWAVPPAALVAKVLDMIVFSRARACVVLPVWSGRPWWPLLQRISVASVPLSPSDFEPGPSGWVEPHKQDWRYVAVLVDGSRPELHQERQP